MTDTKTVIVVETSTVQVEIENDSLVAYVDDATNQIEIGLMGPQGATGSAGPQGPAFSGHNHTQSSPSATWTINHNLGYRPAITTFSVGGTEIEGNIVHVTVNQAQVLFSEPVTGTARAI